MTWHIVVKMCKKLMDEVAQIVLQKEEDRGALFAGR